MESTRSVKINQVVLWGETPVVVHDVDHCLDMVKVETGHWVFVENVQEKY